MAHHIRQICGFWQRGTARQATSGPARDERSAAATRRAMPSEPTADTWIDELQWLAGFPTSWGERRGGWFTGV